MATGSTLVALRQRLLNDIAEIQQDPYPNIHFYIHESDITEACLILTPPNDRPLHLVIKFPESYPLRAPGVTIQTEVDHPNVFDEYICATILNTEDGWTPAYTLKNILIQLLSFFSSDSMQQDYGDDEIDLSSYRAEARVRRARHQRPMYQHSCEFCDFDESWVPPSTQKTSKNLSTVSSQITSSVPITGRRSKLFEMPDEVILAIMSFMDTTDVMNFADTVPNVRYMLRSYDFIRIRELQCFCLKKSFMTTKLGIGVAITGGRHPVFRSEFDLLSNEAYNHYNIRKSIQGVKFEKWLPLPLSRRHWASVKRNAGHALEGLQTAAKLKSNDKAVVLYHFMNSVVVQFSNDAAKSSKKTDSRSTLSHASEKAMESYFALFHLLLCLATEDNSIVIAANRTIERFVKGPRSKVHFPDLGHVLVAALVSDAGLTEELTLYIIKEAILRNVVWMLDTKGAAMAELAYIEPSDVSEYRLMQTFEASRTSYRLLMFIKLFNSIARRSGKSLVQLRKELFDTHGAPPPGTSAVMAQRVRQIREIYSFPGFLTAMGIKDIPTKREFSMFLKRTIRDSVDAGYSRIPMSQSELYMIRRIWEPTVDASKEVKVTPALERWYENGEKWFNNGWKGRPSFFPERGADRGERGRNRGSGRGRGHHG